MTTPSPLNTTHSTSAINSLASGFGYMAEGAKLLLRPGMKRFVLIPILANAVLFVVLTALLIQSFSSLQDGINGLLSSWSWLSYIAASIATLLSGIMIAIILLLYGYSFNLITNIIAAPFYGLLAEKIEQELTQAILPSESFSAMALRTLKREMVKLWYFITRGLALSLLLLVLAPIPFINLLVPAIGLLWATWVMTLQYVDYPADNHQLPFKHLRQRVRTRPYSSMGLGGTIMLGSMIPLVNIVIMPIAVAGGTLFWIRELEAQG